MTIESTLTPTPEVPVNSTTVTTQPLQDIEEPSKTVTPVSIVSDEVFEETTKPTSKTTDTEDQPRKQHKAKLEEPYSSPDTFKPGLETITLPSNHDFEVNQSLESTPHINLMDNDSARNWGQTVKDGLEFNTFAEGFIPTLEDETALYKQSVEFNGQRYNAQAPKIKNTENENLKGERAVLRVIRQLGLGTTFQIPLWHTGIWVTLKPPTEAEIIELNRQMVSEKVRLGRYTYGLVYSNTTSYTVNYIIDFILSHLYTTTVKNEELPVSQLKNFISVQDLFTLVWGFACTMYPKGFQYRRACINDPEKCNHIVEERLNLSKLLWVNVNGLTDWQKSHMSSRQPFLKDLASVKKYKEELIRTKSRRIKLSADGAEETLHITLRSPNITQYITEGEKWITGIVNKVNEAVSSMGDDVERNNVIHRHAQASSMRQYAHWVETIEMGTNVIDDTETICLMLDVMSSDDTIRGNFINETIKYINESTLSVVGIPVFDCPKCGKDQSIDIVNKEFVNIIPLDVIQLFFALSTQRIQRAASR